MILHPVPAFIRFSMGVFEGNPHRNPVSDYCAEGPPVPIPNTEVKLCRGDDTWRATARENSALLTQVGPAGSAAVGVYDVEGPPVPIPNTEVKLCGGDNTWRATAREDSTTPTPPPNASLADFAHPPPGFPGGISDRVKRRFFRKSLSFAFQAKFRQTTNPSVERPATEFCVFARSAK